MNPTVPLTEPQAAPARLGAKAGDDVARLASDEEWPRANKCRVTLIEKRPFGGGLTGAEGAELALPDAAADRRAAPQHRLLLAKAEEILRRARG